MPLKPTQDPKYGVIPTEDAFNRFRAATLKVEGSFKAADAPNNEKDNQYRPRRMKLTSTIIGAGVGTALPMERDEDLDIWEVISNREEIIYGVAGSAMRFDPGMEVTVVRTPFGWVIADYCPVGYLAEDDSPQLDEDIPSFAVVEILPYPSEHKGVARLGKPTASSGSWDRPYAFLGKMPETRPKQEPMMTDPDNPRQVYPKFWPYTTQMPVWVAYDPAADANLPPEVAEALGVAGSDPEEGQRWGVPGSYKLKRTAVLLELYWYKWVPPPPVCTLADVWQFTNVACDHNDPGDPPANVLGAEAPFIAPLYWWSSWAAVGFTYYGWGWNGSAWSYPGWWAGNIYASWWGAWGYGWWASQWYGRPPESKDIPAPVDVQIPQPNVGSIERGELYGWIIWEWGWTVVSVDTDQQMAYVNGPIKFDNRVVVKNPDPTFTEEEV